MESSLYCFKIGRGKPVVLLNPIFSDSRFWIPYILPVLHKYRFYILEYRGYGKSPNFQESKDGYMDLAAQDVAGYIESSFQEPVMLAGVSMGALIGMKALQKLQDKTIISKFLVVDHPISFDPDESLVPSVIHAMSSINDVFHMMEEEKFGKELSLFQLPIYFQNKFFDIIRQITVLSFPQLSLQKASKLMKNPLINRYLIAKILPVEHSWYAMVNALKDYCSHTFDVSEDLKKWDFPVCLFAGTKNALYDQEKNELLLKYKPDAEIVLFKKSGHGLFASEPIKFTKKLSSFLAG